MYKKIMLPIDGSPTSESGMREAIALAAEQHAELVLLHIVDGSPMLVDMAGAVAYAETLDCLRASGNTLLADAKSRAAEAGVQAQTRLCESTGKRVADIIVAEVQRTRCDLVVMGTHGRRGFSRLALGSDADLVVRASPVPVLLVRGREVT